MWTPANMKRSIRRHHADRLKAKRRAWLGGDLTARQLGRMLQTAKWCSCAGCCNKRRSPFNKGQKRLSLDERRFLCEPDEDL